MEKEEEILKKELFDQTFIKYQAEIRFFKKEKKTFQ